MKYYRVSLIDNFASCACNRVRRTRVIIDRRFNKRNEGSSPLSRETRCRRRRGGGGQIIIIYLSRLFLVPRTRRIWKTAVIWLPVAHGGALASDFSSVGGRASRRVKTDVATLP